LIRYGGAGGGAPGQGALPERRRVLRWASASAHARPEPDVLDYFADHGVAGLAGSTNDVVVLLAGMSGDVASALVKRFATKGINSNRILFADLAI
jgi:hypothetical protein